MRTAGTIALLLLAAACRADELHLHDFDGVSSLAAGLQKSDLEVADDVAALGLVVKGPTAPDQAKQPVLAEVKRRIVGVDVMALDASDYQVGIRGFNRRLSSRVLVLIDGRSVDLDFIGLTLWPVLPVHVEEIERILAHHGAWRVNAGTS